jgi:ubiquinone/menaquinone biosynthesis C-methylase UbiE
MTSGPVHGLSKRELFRKAMALRREGRLYDLSKPYFEDGFRGSIDRFCEIAFALRGCRRVLDVGAGGGLLLSLLSELGHECHAVDIHDNSDQFPEIYRDKKIAFGVCNVEADPIPYPDGYFDGVTCCQVLEHFTYSHLHAVREMRRVLRPGGILEIDVPNAACFRNRSRMLRGKHITWDYAKHYLHAEPLMYKGMPFFPDRHNRDFTIGDLRLLMEEAGFRILDIHFLKSSRYREGLEAVRSVGTAMRDAVPSLRKSIIAFGEKAG